MSAWSRRHGILVTYVNDVLKGRRGPSQNILDVLGLERVVHYREKPVTPPGADPDHG